MNQIKDKVGNGKTYGVVDIDAYIDSIKGSMTYRAIGANMIVAGLMSDAQELMAMDTVRDNERARQTLNRAKAVLFQIMDGQLIGTINTNE
jgi:hypothetical protein